MMVESSLQTPDVISELQAAYGQNRFEEALALGRSILASSPTDPSATLIVGLCLRNLRDRHEGYAPIKRALALDPAHVNGLWALAQTSFFDGMTSDAERAARHLDARRPRLPHVRDLLERIDRKREGTPSLRHPTVSTFERAGYSFQEIAPTVRVQPHEVASTADRGADWADYGSDWWLRADCPYGFKYIDTLYPEEYFIPDQGPSLGHPRHADAAMIYEYMQRTYAEIFGRQFGSILELGNGGGEISAQFELAKLDYVVVEGTSNGCRRLIHNGLSPDRIVQTNLKFLEPLGRRFDIVMCTEVAEHIEPFFASKIVDNCVRHGDCVWWSAARPSNVTTYEHANERSREVWDNLFAHMGFPVFLELNGMLERASRMYFSKDIIPLLRGARP